jgi:hypothetical protein
MPNHEAAASDASGSLASSQEGSSWFLRLPAEIRTMIYDLVLVDKDRPGSLQRIFPRSPV